MINIKAFEFPTRTRCNPAAGREFGGVLVERCGLVGWP